MTDVLKQLPHLSFRGIQVPCVSISGGFQHESADHKFQFRDEELIESLGRRNITLAYTVPFREDLFLTPQGQLFTVVFPQWLDACRDRSRGPLVDPILGEIPAKVTQFRYNVDPNKRDGIDVDVEFIHAPEQNSIAELDVTTDEVESTGKAFQALGQQAELVDWKQEPPPEPFVDPFSAIGGVFDQVSANIDKIARTADNMAFKLDKMNKSIDKVADVRNWPIQQSARRLMGSIQRSKERIGGRGRRTSIYQVPVDTQRGPLAANLGNTLGELITLNPRIAQTPVVQANTQVRYYAA